jgi:Uma2 family endonuclease
MALSQAEILYTVAEYLAFERSADERHEYLDGHLYAMAGESLNHGIICTNLAITLGAQLRGTPCLLLSKDMKVRSSPLPQTPRFRKGLFSYPDLVIVCGEPLFHDAHRNVLLNPKVIFELLSPSTEAFDRGSKFLRS